MFNTERISYTDSKSTEVIENRDEVVNIYLLH